MPTNKARKFPQFLPAKFILIATLVLALIACPTGGGGDGGGGGVGGGNNSDPKIAAFKAWLDAQPANTPATAYSATLNVSSLGGPSYENLIKKALKDNSGKYVNLDLSGSTITNIGSSAFGHLDNLTGIILPNSVTSIEGAAFISCTGLASVTIPNSVTSIGNYAFEGCSSLTGITIPASVTSIGYTVFRRCESLTAINVAANNSAYMSESGVLYNKAKTTLIAYPLGKADSSFTIPNGVTNIEIEAFYICNNLISITIPNGVTRIGYSAFGSCNNLASVTIPASVTSIENSAFSYCRSLTGITIPASVTSIANRAFEGCRSLTGITIPNGVTSIGNDAFRDCAGLTSITIPNSVTSIGDSAFAGTKITSVTIPDSVNNIGDRAFGRCTSLTAINVAASNSAYTSENGVLYNKAKTTLIAYPAGKAGSSFTIPNGVAIIGGCSFEYCTSLTSVTIGNSVTSIGDGAFQMCTSLTSVTFEAGSSITSANFGFAVFPDNSTGDRLKTTYLAASPKAGTYTRAVNGATWAKS